MRSVALMLLMFSVIYSLVYKLTEERDREYQRGYHDALTGQGSMDKACVAWWFDANVKDVKEKICGKKR
jgi:hypothetical protein